MKTTARFLPLILLASIAHAADPVPSGEFTKQQLTNEFWAEGAAFGDFNKDGKMDVCYGPYWFAGPDFKTRHTFYSDAKPKSKSKNAAGEEVEFAGFKGALGNENDYSDNFIAYTADFNGDGWADILVIGFPGKEAFWFENP